MYETWTNIDYFKELIPLGKITVCYDGQNFIDFEPDILNGNRHQALALSAFVASDKSKSRAHIRISILDEPFDSENLYNILETQNILDTIKKYISQNKKVLIHCNMGQQRSCAVIACYLIKYNNMNAHTAIEYCKKKRQMAFFGQVNFMDTLMRYI
jgi:protein-tyrosine phosphatase